MVQQEVQTPSFNRFSGDDRARLMRLKADRERIASYADHLNTTDRALLKSVFERGVTPTQLADAGRCSRRQIYRRLRNALDRLNSPMLDFILRNRPRWPEFRRHVAEAIFLRAQTQREVALQLGVSLYEVRKEVERVRTMLDVSGQSHAAPAQEQPHAAA